MQVDGVEGNDTQEVNARHHHARDPEEQDVVACLQTAGWVEPAQVGGVVRPAERAERPEPRAEPGVQHVGVALQLLAAAGWARPRVVACDDDLAAARAVPRRNAMAPPELARDV